MKTIWIRGQRAWLWLLVAVGLLVGTVVSPWFWRLLYPVPFKDLIGAAAEETGLDPFLLVAVMRVESRFNPVAVSPRGARGLMQVMPETGAWVAQQLGLEDFQPEHLHEPATNIRIGAWYLAHLCKVFRGELVPALAAYNGGQGNVRQWLDTLRWSGERETLEDIPFPETRRYVRRVLATYDGYRRAYRGDWRQVGTALGPSGSLGLGRSSG